MKQCLFALLQLSSIQSFTNSTPFASSKYQVQRNVASVESSAVSEGVNIRSILEEADPEIARLLKKETERQRKGLELIASENFCSKNVRTTLASSFTNKYSEGQVNKRYYGGNEYVDELEALCMKRALELYGLDANEWGVNVQPYSGSPANLAVYSALLQPHDRIMGLDLYSGGHLTHGFQTPTRKVSISSQFYESMSYDVDENNLLDYDSIRKLAHKFRPKLLIAGASAYPREWDYQELRKIADEVGAIFMMDMAHISGLVASSVVDSPFEYAHVVTTTTHKTLRGPRSGMIFGKVDLMDKINAAVFPGLQGGPHNNNIAGVAIALKEAATPEFREYAAQVVKNAQRLAEELVKYGHILATGGTDNHLLLWDLRPKGLGGSRLEKLLDRVNITVNKNSLAGDTSAFNPGGVRVGTPALTSRGLKEEDFSKVAEFLHKGYEIAVRAQEKLLDDESSGSKLKDYIQLIDSDEEILNQISSLRFEVEEFSSGFFLPGEDE